MSFQQELTSWLSPSAPAIPVASALEIGQKAPSDEMLPIPPKDGKPVILTFLRHCGCPFAEKTFLSLRGLAWKHKDIITCIAISHSSQESTDKWVISVGGNWDVDVIVDENRKLYSTYGLGVSSAWHVLNPWNMWNGYKLGREEKIWNKPTESGSRWQTAGSWAVDKEGRVVWGGASKSADDVPDFEEAVKALGLY